MQVEFYHTFKIPELGICIEGQWDHNPNKPLLSNCLSSGVAGKTVLDVACRDGWYTMLFKELGATEVTAIDIEDRDARKYIWKISNTKAKFKLMNVYSLAESFNKTKAQVVFTGDLLCHLFYPVRALEAMHNACPECVYLVCDVWPKTEIITPDYPNRWTEDDLVRLMRIAQFKNITRVAGFKLDSNYWRSKGLLPTRDLVLFRCERNPDFVPPPPMNFTVTGSPNTIPELILELDI